MGRITKAEAEMIARKLEAVIVKGGAHDLAQIYHEGRRIAQFGIRRGSNRELPHDYIAAQIYLPRADCERMARCLISRDEWVATMRTKGHIHENEVPPANPPVQEPSRKPTRRRRKP